MNYYKNLLFGGKKSMLRMLLGVMCLVASVVWMYDRVIEGRELNPFDLIYSVFFTLYGILLLCEGFGISVASLWGKAFIRIDNEFIAVKKRVLKDMVQIEWKNINSMKEHYNCYEVETADGCSFTIDFSKLNYSCIQEVKDSINKFANQKGIEIHQSKEF